MNVAERSKLWLQAKADAELDGFMLPPAFAEKAQHFVKGDITLAELVQYYESLLPDEETLKIMYQEYDPGYFEIDTQDASALESLLEPILPTDPPSFNGITLKNIMGMRIALSAYKSLTGDEDFA